MLQLIATTILVLLAIVGLVEICRVVMLMILRTKGENDVMIIVPICGHNEEAELLLRSAAARAKWLGGQSRQKVICLDCGMDEETKEICDLICTDYYFMEVCPLSDFEKSIMETA